jgi:protoheme IX farnesyltransferase
MTVAGTVLQARGITDVVRDYVSLLKLRIVALLDATAIGVMLPASHGHPRVGAVVAVLIGGTLAAGGAHAINCWFDRDIDAAMSRTRRRPLPGGRIPPWHALALGFALNAIAFAVLAAGANLLAAALALAGTVVYVFVYTIWLKRSTPQNIVIGGAAGAIPPLVGWAAATGSLDLTALSLFGVIFFWTPPHFWSLALWANEDYRRAGVPMLPVVAGARETRRQILFYTLVLVPLTLAPFLMGFSGPLYGASAAMLGVTFLYYVYGVVTDRQDGQGNSLTGDAPAKAAFKYSILYLFALFGVLAIDRLVG